MCKQYADGVKGPDTRLLPPIPAPCYNRFMLLLPDFRVRQRDFLLEISRALTSQLNLDEVLKLILQAAASMLGGSVGLIALRQDDEDSFHALASIGVDPELIPLFDPLLEYLAHNTDDDFKTDELNVKIRRLARRLDIHMRQAIALPM